MMKKSVLAKLRQYAEGTVSLFLILILMPFISTAAIYIEVQRYNSVVSLLDEAMGVSSTSVLANMDQFLLDRWGLTAIAQDTDINQEFTRLLEENAGVVPNSLKLNRVSASGQDESALNNSDVLYGQILEASRYSAPITLVNDIVDISELIGALEGIGSIDKIITGISKEVDAMKGIVDYAKDVEELQECTETIETKITNYNDAYDGFESSINALMDSCKELDTRETEVSQLETQVTEKTAQLTAINKQIEDLKDKIALLEKQTQSSSSEESDSQSIEELREQLKSLEDSKKEEEEKSSDITEQYNDAASSRDSQLATVATKKAQAETAREAYKKAIDELIQELSVYPEKMQACENDMRGVVSSAASSASNYAQWVNSTDNLKEQLEDAGNEVERLEAANAQNDPAYLEAIRKRQQLSMEVSQQTFDNTCAKAFDNGVKAFADEWAEIQGEYSEEAIYASLSALRDLRQLVSQFDISNAETKRIYITKTEYYVNPLVGFVGSGDLEEYLEKQKNDIINEDFKAFIKSIKAIIESLFNIEGFYDADLAAYIDTSYYEDKIGGLPGVSAQDGSIISIMEDLGNILDDIGRITGFHIPLIGLYDIVSAVYDLMQNLVNLLQDIANMLLLLMQNISQLLDYKRWYYSLYATYNTSCRTDNSAGTISYKTFLGYSMAELNLKTKGEYSLDLPGIKDISSLISTLQSAVEGSGDDLTFCGAELEYIMFGHNSEIANQLYVFVLIFLYRILVSIPAVMTNAEAQAMAAAATIGAPAVDIVLVIGEALVDAILIVNGVKVKLYEYDGLHLTPTGIAKTVQALVAIAPRDQKSIEKMQEELMKGYGYAENIEGGLTMDDYRYQEWWQSKTGADAGSGSIDPSHTSKLGNVMKDWSSGLLTLSYREYCLLLMMLVVSEGEQMARLSNLIQMESTYYYTQKHADFDFDLKNSYTIIESETDVSVRQMLPSLLDSSLFDIQRTQYRGY